MTTPSLSELIQIGTPELLRHYGHRLTAHQRRALHALRDCRSGALGATRMVCGNCGDLRLRHRSCGHRSCPQCQHHSCSQWLERQRAKLLPVPYFLITFTLPAALRPLAYRQPTVLYNLFFEVAIATLRSFAKNHAALAGSLGATAVLHTHSRQLEYHPHIHVVVPGGVVDSRTRQWRSLQAHYLFNGFNLAKVFRARLLQALAKAGICPPSNGPKKWVAHCERVGAGLPALKYLSRYLYRGVFNQSDIVAFDRTTNTLTFRYKEGKTGRRRHRTLALCDFLWRLRVHVLPRRLRRARDYGFLHGNARAMRSILQVLLRVRLPQGPPRITAPFSCPSCGSAMRPTVVVANLNPSPT